MIMIAGAPDAPLLPDGAQALAARVPGQLWVYGDPAVSTGDAARVHTTVIAHVQKVAR